MPVSTELPNEITPAFDGSAIDGIVKPRAGLGRCAVIGGGGYVGFRIVRALLRYGHQVGIMDLGMISEAKEFTDKRGDVQPALKFFRVDIRDFEELSASFRSFHPQTVFHVASYGMSGREMLNKQLIEEVNINGVRNTLQACTEAAVQRLVYTSSYNTVYGGQTILDGNESNSEFLPIYKHPDHYALTKCISEQLVLISDRKLSLHGDTLLRTCSLRLPGIYGPGEQRHLPRIISYLKKGWIRFKYGEGIVDFVHVENVVQAHILAAEALGQERDCIAAGQAYFINDGKPINNFEFFRPLMEGLGYSFPKTTLPFSFIFYVAIILEFLYGLDFVTRHNLDRYFPLLTRTEVYKTGLTHFFSIDKARKELGYVPRDPPNDLREIIQSFKDSGHCKVVAKSGVLDKFFRQIILLFFAVVVFFGVWGRLVL